jgi:hypothetical protein
MGVGQIISDTFGIVKARFAQLLALWAIYFGITIALSFVLFIGLGVIGAAGSAALSESNLLAVGGGAFVVIALFYIGYLVVAVAQYASMILIASPAERTTVGAALSAGWRAAPALLLLMVVLILAYLAGGVVFGLVGRVLGDIGGGVLALLLIPVLIWIGCRLAPLFAVEAVDGVRNPITAIGRAWDLTRGHALTIFLASLVLLVIFVVICGIALLPSIGLLRSMADPEALVGAEAAGAAVSGFLLLMLGFLVVSVVVNMVYCAFIAVVHGTLTGAGGEKAAEAFA